MHGQHVVRRERGCTERVNSSLGAEREREPRETRKTTINNMHQLRLQRLSAAASWGCWRAERDWGGEERGPREKACRPRE